MDSVLSALDTKEVQQTLVRAPDQPQAGLGKSAGADHVRFAPATRFHVAC